MSEFAQIDGYVADSAYPSKLHPQFQAPWIDAVLALHRIVPPRSVGEPFTLVDLGCGDGIGLILAAASHPQGRFIGIDAIPQHVARGQAVVAGLGLTNINLICGGFADLADQADGSAHYLTAQGVLAWISPENRAALIDLASAWLKPGGAFCVGYNSFPGWGKIAPFQALVRATSLEHTGTSAERFDNACRQLRQTDVIGDNVWDWLDELRGRIAESYFAHEYLNAHWQPCWSGDVVEAMGSVGLAYVGQAGNQRLRDDLCYSAAWRDTLAGFASVAAREIAADLLSESWFRRDLYLKPPGRGSDAAETQEFRMTSWWMLSSSDEPEQPMLCATAAGQIDFNNRAASAILSALEDGPTSLSAIAQQTQLGPADLLNSIDALWIAERVVPVDKPIANGPAEAVNAWFDANDILINGRATSNGAISALMPH